MTLPAKISAALIDMDGVLYDSMRFHANAWKRLTDEIGMNIDPVEFFIYEGMTGTAIIDLLFRREFGRPALPQEAKELYARKSKYFIDCGPTQVMPGAPDMLATLKSHDIQTILVTGSGQHSLLDRLNADFPGVFAADKMVTALNVKHGKPNPEPYLKGLALAGSPAHETIVIENAPLGVRAGRAAGLFTIAVTTGPIPLQNFIDEDASAIFPSMTNFAQSLQSML